MDEIKKLIAILEDAPKQIVEVVKKAADLLLAWEQQLDYRKTTLDGQAKSQEEAEEELGKNAKDITEQFNEITSQNGALDKREDAANDRDGAQDQRAEALDGRSGQLDEDEKALRGRIEKVSKMEEGVKEGEQKNLDDRHTNVLKTEELDSREKGLDNREKEIKIKEVGKKK